MKLTAENIRAIGTFLSSYQSDLSYISNFQDYKLGKIKTADYIQKGAGSFKSFINDFRVARNIDKDETGKLLSLTMEWVRTKSNALRIDEFAEQLKNSGISRNKTPYSLASKILFLNDPWNVLPNDALARNTVGCTERSYAHYKPKLEEYINSKVDEISHCLDTVEKHSKVVEKHFKHLEDIKTIRHNRFVDKLLWSGGK